MTVVAAGALTNTGAIDAAARLELQGGAIANSGQVAQHDGAGAALNAGGRIGNSGSIVSAGALELRGSDIADNNGVLQATGELRLQAGAVSLAGTSMASAAGVRISATGGPLAAAGTRVRAASWTSLPAARWTPPAATGRSAAMRTCAAHRSPTAAGPCWRMAG